MSYSTIKSIFQTVLLLLLLTSVASASVLSPRLSVANDSDSLITVVVFLDTYEQSSKLQLMAPANRSYNRAENIKNVISKLTSYRADNQLNIESYLNQNSKEKIIKHWIVPAYTAQLTLTEIKILSELQGVKSIIENAQLNFEAPIKNVPAPLSTSIAISNELSLMNIPALWNKGLKGKGSLICSFDTGVDGTHPALASKWRGNHTALSASWFSKVAPESLPQDATGHGTHTMGVMVGSMDADSFGVAPEAEWITAGVIDQGRSLSMTLSDIIEAFQWSLNPDGDVSTTDDVPDVILNSWGIPKGLFFPCDDTFWGVIDNVEAAGIVTIFAAGNEGPEPMSIRSPADRATTPLNSFSVGAVNINKEVADFSSRGPSSCDPTQIKPEVVAPGVNIRSSTKGGGFAYMSGTSMAAPYIAGSVALIRQYNENATVEQIKNAFIQAAIDLGEANEDNSYGHGFVDLQSILQYIPLPLNPLYEITSYNFSNPYILPGESFELFLTLQNSFANVETAIVQIKSADTNLTIQSNSETFFFGVDGTIAQNANAYQMTLDSSLAHGAIVDLQVLISSTNTTAIDTVALSLTVGVPSQGTVATHQNSKLNLSVSDFGSFGFAPGSLYNLSSDGFRFNNSPNLLYETGLVIGRSALQMSTSIRDENGSFKKSDFNPIVSLSGSSLSASGEESRTAVFDDSKSTTAIPIEVHQETIHSNISGEEGLLIVKYRLENSSIQTISNLYFGALHDFDLSQSDKLQFDNSLSLVYQTDDNGIYVGVVALKNIDSFRMFENSNGKIGFTNNELFITLTEQQNNIDNSVVGDMMFFTSSALFSLAPNQSFEIAYAYVCGNSINELYDNAVLAQQKFDITTGIDDNNVNLPKQFELLQNYPNPFNPTTTIQFNLASSSDIKLEIYNVLGQKVKTLVNRNLPAGSHEYQWDATDNANSSVASGIYFYKLSSDTQFETQKMTLLK